MILSAQNELIKKIASLKQKKYRDKLNLFCVEGIRLAEEAVASRWPVQMCVYTKTALGKVRVADCLAKLASGNNNKSVQIPLIEVSEEVYGKITDTQEPQGIMLVLEKCFFCFDDFIACLGINTEKMPLIAVLDGVSDPGNVGTIIRTSDAAGCAGVVLLKGSADLFNGKTLRAAMGSVFHLPIIENVAQSELTAVLKKYGVSLLAAELDNDARVYYQHDFQKPLAVAFGNEGGGLSREILSFAHGKIYIPLNGQAESLNVAVAAGVILYEAARQQPPAALTNKNFSRKKTSCRKED